jgi:hypothetical protein
MLSRGETGMFVVRILSGDFKTLDYVLRCRLLPFSNGVPNLL